MIQQLKKIATRYQELCELLKDENLFQDSAKIQSYLKNRLVFYPPLNFMKKSKKQL